MSVKNLVRVRDNIQMMVDQGAPESDIDGYLKTEGYTPDRFRTAVGKYQKQVSDVDYGVGSEMLSGLTFGFGDELRSKVTGEPLEAIQESQNKYRKANPVASTVANIAGSLPTALIPYAGAANVMRGVGMAGKAARVLGAAATGAGYGGLTGAGESTEGNRASGAAKGAALGAIASPIGAGIGRSVQAISQRRLKSLPSDLDAQARLLGTFQAAGIKPQSVAPVQGKTLSELAAPLENLAGAVVRKSPTAAGEFAKLTTERKAARGPDILNRAQQEITRGFAPTANQIDKLTTAQKKAATPYYDQAFSEAGPIQSPLIDDLMTLEPFQMAYKRAQRIAELESKGKVKLQDYMPGQPLTLAQTNYIKQGLDEIVYGAKRDPASSIGKQQLSLIDQLRGDFVREVDSQAPESYRVARGIYSSAARDKEAADLGAEAIKQGPEFVADFMKSATESERQAFRASANAELQRKAGDLGQNAEVFRRLLDTPNRQAVMQQLSQVEGPSAIPYLAQRQAQEADFATRMTGGAQTAPRQAADALLQDGESLPEQVLRQGPVNAMMSRALQATTDLYRTGGSKTANDLGGLLFNTDASANTETLRRLGLLDEQLKRQAGIRAGAYTSGAATTGGLLGGYQQ